MRKFQKMNLNGTKKVTFCKFGCDDDDLCHGGSSSCQLFLSPHFYAKSCKGKISFLLQKSFRAEPRV